MTRNLVASLLRFLMSLAVASLAIFILLRVVPGDPARIALGVNATDEALAAKREELGTDRPLFVQYWEWLSGLFQGKFGVSVVTKTDITPIIMDRFQVSLILVTLAILLALILAIPLGSYAAMHRRQVSGVVVNALSQLGMAIPGFLAGILLVAVFAVRLGWFPANGWTPPDQDFGDFIRRLVLPVTALAAVQTAVLTRYMRSAVLEVWQEDFIRTARAKGLSPRQTLLKHGLRNAAIPVLTVTALQFATLIIGAVVIERVFVIPGIGSYLVDAVATRDLQVVQSLVMVLVALTLVVNLCVEVLYSVLDPRIRVQGAVA